MRECHYFFFEKDEYFCKSTPLSVLVFFVSIEGEARASRVQVTNKFVKQQCEETGREVRDSRQNLIGHFATISPHVLRVTRPPVYTEMICVRVCVPRYEYMNCSRGDEIILPSGVARGPDCT